MVSMPRPGERRVVWTNECSGISRGRAAALASVLLSSSRTTLWLSTGFCLPLSGTSIYSIKPSSIAWTVPFPSQEDPGKEEAGSTTVREIPRALQPESQRYQVQLDFLGLRHVNRNLGLARPKIQLCLGGKVVASASLPSIRASLNFSSPTRSSFHLVPDSDCHSVTGDVQFEFHSVSDSVPHSVSVSVPRSLRLRYPENTP